MPSYSSQHQRLIDTLLAAATPALPPQQAAFVQAFYAHAPVSDLEELPPAEGLAIAQRAYDVLQARGTEQRTIRITPTKYDVAGHSHPRTEVIAINADKPFLVDSLSALCTALGLTIHRIEHPILAVGRDENGAITTLGRGDEADPSLPRESLIYMELSPLPLALSVGALEAKLREVLAHVEVAVHDWQAMRQRLDALAETCQNLGEKGDADASEIADLLHWFAENHLVLLGVAEYRVADAATPDLLTPAHALGIYSLPGAADAMERALSPTTRNAAVRILKASEMGKIHRHATMDYIAIRQQDAAGNFLGEIRILGLFTSTVYYRETDHIPLLRRKTANILTRAGFDLRSHSGKTLKTALEFLPRDELFQMEEEPLFQMAMGIVSLDARPRVRVFLRRDPFHRFISAMVYVPRERFSTGLREEIVKVLERSYEGKFLTFYTHMTDAPLARVTIQIATNPNHIPVVDEAALEARISALANVWGESLRGSLLALVGEEQGESWAQSFAHAFPLAYVNSHSADAAALDVRCAMQCIKRDGLSLALYRKADEPADQLHLKCFTKDLHSELSGIIPLLENMGCTVLDATPYILTPHTPLAPVLMRNFTLRVASASQLDFTADAARIEAAIAAIWRGASDNDTLNALVVTAGLAARDVTILRAYSRYLQQLNFPYSQSFIAGALKAHGGIAQSLVALFHARFDPAFVGDETARAQAMQSHVTAITTALQSVTNLAEDRIIRRILAVMQATLRTNFYQTTSDGAPKPYLSMKIRSSHVPEMPLPVPYAEIFVTSQRMEGIHLRGGTVARGGLRWSDRPEDFRTEVLGLVKAQMVKNAVIVPQGAKGGFILRKPPLERDALMEEGIACYRMFLSGLLDITDNIDGNNVLPPLNVVRHDDDDPYLVVAADKGTATFSDIANGVAADYGFWLGDAFASGGSVGYDHKAMGITAKGGWVAVERHFREMGHDMDTTPFTCVGIGDMSGDVFGNGMLLSRQIKLVAAFNHRHIFFDPTPDVAASYAERARLFALPRSGWNDYDATLISQGGGVFDRSAKSITLTPQVQAMLATDVTEAAPDELIRLILQAPVDLLWNGGIGTYVKAATETHEQVGDRANNGLRVNGGDLNCKIVGEGGNLGFTQRGRIEYAHTGGRINTDAIDNSAGVDCSDHEVNIKIALGHALAVGRTDLEQRNALLKDMTDEVSRLVLRDNQLQTQAISIAEGQGHQLLDPAEQLMQQLESEQFLNRAVEFLPDSKQIAEMRAARQGFTRPELSVLLAYAKMALYRDLKDSPVMDDPYFEADLLRYFPTHMQQPYAEDITTHRLRRDIVATMVTNSIVNRAGFGFAHGLMRATGLGAAEVAQAYIATRDVFGLRSLWAAIEGLDGVVPASLQSGLFGRVNGFIEQSCRWFLSHVPQPMALQAVTARYAQGVAELAAHAETVMSDTLRKSYQHTVADLTAQSVPKTITHPIALLEMLSSACDIIDVAATTGRPLAEVARTYFELGARLKLGWMRRNAAHMAAENYWQQLAVKSLMVELYQAQRRLTQEVLLHAAGQSDPAEQWVQDHRESYARYLQFVEELRTQTTLDYAMLIVALRQVQGVIGD